MFTVVSNNVFFPNIADIGESSISLECPMLYIFCVHAESLTLSEECELCVEQTSSIIDTQLVCGACYSR